MSESSKIENQEMALDEGSAESVAADEKGYMTDVVKTDESAGKQAARPLDHGSEGISGAEESPEYDQTLQERDRKIKQLEEGLEALRKENAHITERSRGELAALRIISGIKDAAVECGFIDPAEAAMHLKDLFGISAEGVLFKGRRVKDADLPRVIGTAVRNLSDVRPHLIRFEYKSGAGAEKTGSPVEAPSGRRDFSDLKTKREYEEELKRRGIQPLNPV